MSKLIWITATITALVAVIISWEAKRCYAEAEKCKSAPQAEFFLAPLQTRITASVNQKQPPDETSRACAHADRYLCAILTPANLPTIYLVIIGVGGIVIGIGTLRGIQEQTTHLVNSERSWIIPRFNYPNSDRRIRILTTSKEMVIDLILTLHNSGKTPAWITERRITLKVVESIPPNPLFGDQKGGDFWDFPHYPTATENSFDDDIRCSCERVDIEGKTVIVYGYVKYRDVFCPERWAYFGCEMRNGYLYRIPSESYNHNS